MEIESLCYSATIHAPETKFFITPNHSIDIDVLSEVIYSPAGTIESGTPAKASSVRFIFRDALNRDAVVLRGEDAERAWKNYRRVVDPHAVQNEELDEALKEMDNER